MSSIGPFVLAAFFSANLSQASMNGDILLGTSLDPRVTRCGIRIDGADMARIAPFIETSQNDLSGRVRLEIAKRSSSGSSITSQVIGFAGGSLGSLVVVVDRPSHARIVMTVSDNRDGTLCQLEREIELVATRRKI